MNNHTYEVYKTLEASIEEFRLALRLLNEPYHSRYMEGCIVHLKQAWLYLYQAAMVKSELNLQKSSGENKFKDLTHEILLPNNVITVKAKPRLSFIFDGESEQGFYTELKHSSINTNSFSNFEIYLYKNTHKVVPLAYLNLKLILEIRNEIEHRVVINDPSTMLYVLPYIISNVHNYLVTLDQISIELSKTMTYASWTKLITQSPELNWKNDAHSSTRVPIPYSVLYSNESYLDTIKLSKEKILHVFPRLIELIDVYERFAQVSMELSPLEDYSNFRLDLDFAFGVHSKRTRGHQEISSEKDSMPINLKNFTFLPRQVKAELDNSRRITERDVIVIARHFNFIRVDKDKIVTDNEHVLYIHAANKIFLYSRKMVKFINNLSDEKILEIKEINQKNKVKLTTMT